MDSLKIKRRLMSFLLYDKKHAFVVPNLMFGSGESDVISITKSGYIHEVEIKISKSDFKADAKKKKWKFYGESIASGKKVRPRWDTPNYFWYCFPEEMIEELKFRAIEVDSKFGILSIKNDKIKIVRDAPKFGNKKATRRLVNQITRSLSFKLLNALEYQESSKGQESS